MSINKIKKKLVSVFITQRRNEQQIINSSEEKRLIIKWDLEGKNPPIPNVIKRDTIKSYSKKFKTKILIETGTYLGDTVESCRKNFEKIYSIELSENLYKNAVERFAIHGHIKIIQGDSGEKLRQVLDEVDGKCLFWLDGHYSEGITAKAIKNTPIMEELTDIFNHKNKGHIVLIDDARLFVGKDDYPTMKELRSFINNKRPDLHIHNFNDIIRIHP